MVMAGEMDNNDGHGNDTRPLTMAIDSDDHGDGDDGADNDNDNNVIDTIETMDESSKIKTCVCYVLLKHGLEGI